MSLAENLSISTATPEGRGLVASLLTGTAKLGRFMAAEPEDAAEALLAGEPADSTAFAAFDRECLSELENFRATLLKLNERAFDVALGRLVSLMAIVRRVKPKATVRHLHANYVAWNSFFENFVVDGGLDLHREYWRILALTQDLAAEAGLEPRRLMPLWLSICAECGGTGLYPVNYLRISLMGLRQLPLGDKFDSNEDFALHGMARWAAARKPSKKEFMREWRLLEGDFPSAPDFWQEHVENTIASLEREISERTHHAEKTFEAAAWWREDVEVGDNRRRPANRAAEPPARELLEKFLRLVGEPFGKHQRQLDQLIAGHRRYAEATGDVFYLVRTACNIGMELIRNSPPEEKAFRGEAAIGLAKLVFVYDSANVFAWSLFRRAHVAANRLLDAEMIGWETIRRFPEDPHQRTQLATVLAERLNRPEEAAALLKDTIALFPENAFAHNQLATILADDLRQYGEAREMLVAAQQAGVSNDATRTLLIKLNQNRPLRGSRTIKREPEMESLPLTLNLPGAIARRALFRFENGLASQEETASIMAIQPPDPYVAYAAGRAEIWQSPLQTTFSLAFEEAARKGSAPALLALIGRARPLERMLIDQAVAVLEQRLAPAANDEAKDGAALRLSKIVSLFSGKHAPAPQQRLVLLRDMSASLLSTSVASLAA